MELFSRCSFPPPTSSFKPGLKVLFPRDLKVTRYSPPPTTSPFKRPRARLPAGTGKRHKKGKNRVESKNVLATLFCQLGRPNLKQHRLPSDITGGESGTARRRTTSRARQKRKKEQTPPPPSPIPTIAELSGVLAEFRLLSYLGRDEGAGECHFGQRRLLLGAVM